MRCPTVCHQERLIVLLPYYAGSCGSATYGFTARVPLEGKQDDQAVADEIAGQIIREYHPLFMAFLSTMQHVQNRAEE